MSKIAKTITTPICYHCGEDCLGTVLHAVDKDFCCSGCKMVYGILQQNGLCDYYAINHNPGTRQNIKIREDKFSYLDDGKIGRSLLDFTDECQSHITFYLPQIHCSSCL